MLLALDDELVRWQVSGSSTARTSVPIKRTELQKRIARYTRAIVDPASDAWETQSDELATLLIGPIMHALPKRLLIVTDALISSVPFATLRLPGAADLLVDAAELEVLASQRLATTIWKSAATTPARC